MRLEILNAVDSIYCILCNNKSVSGCKAPYVAINLIYLSRPEWHSLKVGRFDSHRQWGGPWRLENLPNRPCTQMVRYMIHSPCTTKVQYYYSSRVPPGIEPLGIDVPRWRLVKDALEVETAGTSL